MKYNLFLDDIRQPSEVTWGFWRGYQSLEWQVVRNYDEFIHCIELNGLPELISFDHDLALEHYTPQEYWSDYRESMKFQDARQTSEKTGLDCARWLTRFCRKNRLKLPQCRAHSMNPVGRENIIAELRSFR